MYRQVRGFIGAQPRWSSALFAVVAGPNGVFGVVGCVLLIL